MEKRNQALDGSGAKAHVKEEHSAAAVSTNHCLKPACFNKEADSASKKQRERTNSEVEVKPAELKSEPGPVIQQATEALPRQNQAAGLIQNSCDGEEKRDRPKEEPPLEISPLEG